MLPKHTTRIPCPLWGSCLLFHLTKLSLASGRRHSASRCEAACPRHGDISLGVSSTLAE